MSGSGEGGEGEGVSGVGMRVSKKVSPSFPKTYLQDNFIPKPQDILCSKGKRYYDHEGNENFRRTIFRMLPKYSRAKTKLEKSAVVNEILQDFRSNNANFVRQDSDGRYYEIGDDAAREKIGQTVRDSLIRQDPAKQFQKRQRRARNKAKRVEAAKAFAMSLGAASVIPPTTTTANGEQDQLQPHSSPPVDVLQFPPTHVMVEYDPVSGRPREVLQGALDHTPHHVSNNGRGLKQHRSKEDNQKVAALALLGIAQGVNTQENA